ncbi:MAG: 2-amino-4-hydroxy-6-hydroxymethyldihydropteridine diphosphokinase [Candidatus Dasytiphilus stammeri]
MNRVYLALGSNLNNPFKQVNMALDALSKINNSNIIKVSNFYRTFPLGSLNQKNYLNAAVAIDSNLQPETFLNKINQIELKQGRIRTIERWISRTIDIDIMLYGNLKINTNNLVIPHYAMEKRAFMLVPLLEIAPQVILPDGTFLRKILQTLDTSKISLWS